MDSGAEDMSPIPGGDKEGVAASDIKVEMEEATASQTPKDRKKKKSQKVSC